MMRSLIVYFSRVEADHFRANREERDVRPIPVVQACGCPVVRLARWRSARGWRGAAQGDPMSPGKSQYRGSEATSSCGGVGRP